MRRAALVLSLFYGCGEAPKSEPAKTPVNVGQKSASVAGVIDEPPGETPTPPAKEAKEAPPPAPEPQPEQQPQPQPETPQQTLSCHARCSGAEMYEGYAWEETFTVAAVAQNKFAGKKTWQWEGPNGLLVFTLDLDLTAKSEWVHDTSTGGSVFVENGILEGTFDFTSDQQSTSGYSACYNGCDAALVFQPNLTTEFGPIVNFMIDCDAK